MGWIAAADGYEVALVNGKVTCRPAGGKPLKTVPKPVRETPAVDGLRQLQEWLERHDVECQRTVDDWLVRSLPVPAAVVASVWPDQAWRAALTDLVVAPVSPRGDGTASGFGRDASSGFLRDVDADGRLGVVNLDGESVWLDADRILLPHPVLLPDLADLREFAVELGVRQGTLQLFRETWPKPETAAELSIQAAAYSGGHFAQLRHLAGRAATLGYVVRGGYVLRRLWEGGRAVDACVWIGADDPSQEAETGDLMFSDAGGSPMELAEVGPVSWSEGLRMAAALYAGRVVTEEATT